MRVTRHLLVLLTALLLASSLAAAANDVNMNAAPSSLQAGGAATSTVTAGAPVMDAGVIQQEIVQSFDPSKLEVTGSDGIRFPAGWTLSYSSDGTTFGPAPNSPSGWDAIRAVKASGAITSEGSYQGYQVATASAVATTPISGSFSTAPGSGGDGWNVFFDGNGHVFNAFHHDGFQALNPKVDCHTRLGTSCGPGWPFDVSPFHTGDESSGWVLGTKMWLPTNTLTDTGFICIDVSAMATGPRWCNGTAAASYRQLGNGDAQREWDATNNKWVAEFRGLAGWAVVGTKYYSIEQETGKVICLDMAANAGQGAACPNQPYSFPPVDNSKWKGGAGAGEFSLGTLKVSNGQVYGSAPQGLTAWFGFCIDPATNAACAGWATPKRLPDWSNIIYEMPNAVGDIDGVCFEWGYPGDKPTQCYTAAGRAVPREPGLAAAIAVPAYNILQVDNPITVGSKVLWSNGYWSASDQAAAALNCFDVATNASCPGWPINTLNYTLTVDPDNPSCFWKNTDDGSIGAFDVTGAVGCSTPPPWADISAELTVPRMACDPGNAVRAWRRVALVEPDAGSYRKAYLTVYDAGGKVVESNGIRWSGIAFPASTREIDLAQLAVADSGQKPTFRVTFAGRTTTQQVRILVTAVGDAPELCVPLKAETVCPVAPSQAPSPMYPPTPVAVTGRGSATITGGTVVPFTSATTNITLTPPADADCLGSIGGQATVLSSPTPAVGVTVILRNAQGNEIARAVTDAGGNYSFPRIAAGTGYRVDFADAAGFVTTAATVTGEATDRTVTAGATTTVNGQFATRIATPDRSVTVPQDSPAVFDPFANVGSSAGATPSGTEQATGSFTAAEKAMTRLCNPYATPAEVAPNCTATTVPVPGEGTWTVNTDPASPNVGKITFVPDPGYTGAARPMGYQVTDVPAANTPVTAGGTLSPLLQPAVAVNDAKTTKVSTAVLGSVATNDTVAPAYRYRLTSQPANGTVVMASDGTYTYTPNPGFTGTDPFTYETRPVTCPGAGSTSAVVAPDFSYVTGAAVIGRSAPANLVVNGDFTQWPATDRNGAPVDPTSQYLWSPTTTLAGLQAIGMHTYFGNPLRRVDLPGWTETGGGTGTYASVGRFGAPTFTVAGSGASTESAYFGNYWDWTTSPWLSWDSHGLDRTAHTFTTNSTVNGGNATPITLYQDIPTTVGTVYRLQFAQLAEVASFDGIAALEVTGYGRTYFRVEGTARRLTFEFVATSTTTRASFLNWGHVKQVIGAATGSHELALDDVMLNACPDGPGVTATATMTVAGAPQLVNDTNTGPWDTNQTISPLVNDQAGLAPGVTLSAASVRICTQATANASCGGTTLTTADGTYTVSNGQVVFDPLPSFTGVATQPIKYVATDSYGQTSSALITPTVLEPALSVANPDTSTGKMGQAQSVNLLANDTTVPGITLTTSTLRLCNTTTTPAQEAPNCTATSVYIAGKGTYSVNTGTAVATFTPDAGFSGPAPALPYQVTDSRGRVITSTYTPNVIPPPTAYPDVNTGPWDTNQVILPYANDLAAAPYTLDRSSVRICPIGTAPASCTGTKLDVAGQGTYYVNTSTGAITFDPLPGFVGQATQIMYVIEDSAGQQATSTIQPTVAPPPPPDATPQTKLVQPGGTVAFTTLTGTGGLATPGGPALNTSATCLLTPGTQSCDADGVVVVPGQGTWTLTQNTGVVTFQPLPGVAPGQLTPIEYKVVDVMGGSDISTLTPIVPPPPSASNDSSVAEQNVTQVVSVLSNDAPGDARAPLVPSSVRLCDTTLQTPQAPPNCSATTVFVAGKGTYTANADGTISFAPVSNFVGTAPPLPYIVKDTLGQVADATLTVTVGPPPTVILAPDAESGPFRRSLTFTPLANDSAGNRPPAYQQVGTFVMDAASVRLCAPGELGVVANPCTATSLERPEGTYTVNTAPGPDQGKITFQPGPEFVGTPVSPPSYMACNDIGGTWLDANGNDVTNQVVETCSTAVITPTIGPPDPPVAVNDSSVGPWNAPQLIEPLVNDSGADGLQLVPETIRLCDMGQSAPNCSANQVVVSGEGTYTLDPATAKVTFQPLPSFTGRVSTVRYQVADQMGQVTQAAIHPSVTPLALPLAAPDTSRGPWRQPQVLDVMANDTSDFAVALSSPTVFLCGPLQVAPQCDQTRLEVPGEGVYEVGSGGKVTFTPDPDFVGPASQVRYQVSDTQGQVASSTIDVTVDPSPLIAEPASATTPYNRPVSLRPTAIPGTWPVDASKTCLAPPPAGAAAMREVRVGARTAAVQCDPGQTRLQMPEGVYDLDPVAGVVIFTPAQGFTGTPANPPFIVYTDTGGQRAEARLVPTVLPPPARAAMATPAPPGAPAPPAAKAVLRIRTITSRPVLRPGQTATITLKVTNRGRATALSTVTRAAIPKGFAVVAPRGGTVRDGFIYFRTGDIASKRTVTRTFVLVATRGAVGHRATVLGRSKGGNVRTVRDPALMRVLPEPPNAAVTG